MVIGSFVFKDSLQQGLLLQNQSKPCLGAQGRIDVFDRGQTRARSRCIQAIPRQGSASPLGACQPVFLGALGEEKAQLLFLLRGLEVLEVVICQERGHVPVRVFRVASGSGIVAAPFGLGLGLALGRFRFTRLSCGSLAFTLSVTDSPAVGDLFGVLGRLLVAEALGTLWETGSISGVPRLEAPAF